MRILVVADEESKYLWDFYEDGKLKDVDLILSAGDLNPNYLSFLVTFSNVPVLYVRGNHDDKYEKTPPEGCICIEDDIYVHEGVRILGLGGSMRYKPGENQYTERQMRMRVRKLWWKLFRHKGFDILLTHSPALQLNDGRDLPHQGFRVFRDLMEKYRPKFFIHGHVHMSYGRQHKRYDKYQDTHIINAYERCFFDFEAEDVENNLTR
ncbi:MAG: metallophosphoesterase [Clostridiales bacterium]|nr:metallophosphoesterase [Candidatus Blautia equi]